MPVATLSLPRPHGRRLRVMVVTADRGRRRRIARAMAALGWPHQRIAAALRIRGERVAGLLAEPTLFDPATLKEAARVPRRMVAA